MVYIGSNEETIIVIYRTELQHLLDCLMAVQVQWKEYGEILEARVEEFSFQVDTTRTHLRGRPKVNVFKEQLEYLSSLGFSWTDVDSLIGN